MEVQLTTDQKAFARRAVETGRLHNEEEVVEEALALWEAREWERLDFVAAVDAARASIARGVGKPITEDSVRELTEEVKTRGRARLMAELADAR
jgi:Arc/MetJ-type ribon-helix-helix transcriptional regulator